MTFLETQRLLFRTHGRHDEEPFVAMHADPEVRRYVGGTPWSPEKARDRFRTQFAGKPRRTFGLWATVLKEDGRYIGHCGLTGARSAPSLAYYIAPAYWGRGFATEAAIAFVETGFARLNLTRVLATVERGHLASERILQRLRFTLEREERIAGTARVLSHYLLLRPSNSASTSFPKPCGCLFREP